jgi:glycosyltransferase involved in cell wall biosynthesis
MRLWIINQYAVTPQEPGGTRHYNLSRELVQRGHEVTIVTSSVNYITRSDTHLDGRESWKQAIIDGVRFVWLCSPEYRDNGIARLWNMIAFARNVAHTLRCAQLNAPDVILGSSPPIFAAFAAARMATSLKLPFILEVRDIWPQSLVELGNFTPGHPFIRILERMEKYLYTTANLIISPLPSVRSHIEEKCGRNKAVVWIPNGVDCKAIPFCPPVAHADPFTIMFAGAHNLANDLDPVLDAAALLQQDDWLGKIRFRFVGDGPQKPKLLQRALQLDLRNVSFENQVAKSAIYSVLQESDAFILSTRNTALYRFGVSPNKLHDYMAAGRPTIVAMTASNNPVLLANAGIVVPPENAKAIADAAKTLWALPLQTRVEMGNRARNYIQEHQDFANLAIRLEHALNEALGRHDLAVAA